MKAISAAEMAKGNGLAYSPSEMMIDLIDLCEKLGIEKSYRLNRIDGVWRQQIVFRSGSGDFWEVNGSITKLGYWSFTVTRNGQAITVHKMFRYLGVWK
jgi:hypothetical protein